MIPSRQITPTAWMTDYRSVKVMNALGAYDNVPKALFVGGCVRNALLELDVGDIDIATMHHPLQVIEKLKEAGIRHIPTGLDHGTLTAIFDDATFEITTLRKDIDTDGRYAVIAFTQKWEEDAQRRDFTMNTLLASPDGSVFDPTGKGLDDLDARRVVFVGDPQQRIAEDYLRILRFYRFYGQYGKGDPDKAARDACAAGADKLEKLSKERVTQEFLKILGVANPVPVLTLMRESGILSSMLAGLKPQALSHLCQLQQRYDAKDVLSRMSLFSDNSGNAFEEWMVLSNAQKKVLADLSQGVAALKSINKKSMRALVYAIGNVAALQSYLIRLSLKEDLPDLEIVDIARYWQAPSFPVTGQDLMAAGIASGPAMGKKLKDLEAKWIAKDFPADFKFK